MKETVFKPCFLLLAGILFPHLSGPAMAEQPGERQNNHEDDDGEDKND